MCVAVATARRPQGPFRHRARIGCGGVGGSLDPAPLAVGRRVYLYFARTDAFCRQFPGRCSIVGLRLSRNLLHARGRPRRLIGIDQPWEGSRRYAVVENPWMIHRGGWFYLLYSANHWRYNYGMGYAVSRSPLGPFRKPESRPFLHSRMGISGPGGGSAIIGPHGGLWLVYAARRLGVGFVPDRRRALSIDRLVVGGGRVRLQGPSFGSKLHP
jgi:hypothetical protein